MAFGAVLYHMLISTGILASFSLDDALPIPGYLPGKEGFLFSELKRVLTDLTGVQALMLDERMAAAGACLSGQHSVHGCPDREGTCCP
jgi:hypothetical protein